MPLNPTINYIVLDGLLAPEIERACGKQATAIAQKKFEQIKTDFLNAFLENPVTQEIEEGAKLDPGSILERGNLFGFIGFEEHSDPIGDLYEYLVKSIYMMPQGQYIRSRKEYDFYVITPSKDDIADATPMPWGTSRSWVFAIESGISGLNNYLYKDKYGRSGGGIQIKNQLRSGGYTPQKYMSSLLNFLKDSLA